MSQKQDEIPLHIDTFQKQVELLCKPYEHPKYLELIEFKSDPQKKLKDDLNKIINETLSQPKTVECDPKALFSLKTSLQDCINSTLKEETGSLKVEQSTVYILKENLTAKLTELQNNLKTTITKTKENSSSHEPYNIFLDALRENLINCIQPYIDDLPKLIQAIISRDPGTLQNEEENITKKQDTRKTGLLSFTPNETSRLLEKRCTCLDNIIVDLWISFSKSLLEGELLKDAKYSITLKEIIKKIRETLDSSGPEEIIYLHPILPRIHELCQELSYVCQRVRIQIKDSSEKPSSKHKVFHAPVVDLAGKPYAGPADSAEVLKANLFHDLGKRLIEMTRIDITGVIDDQTVTSLMSLHKQCERLEKNGEAKRLEFPTNVEIKRIFKAIKAKTSLLLFQSFYKPQINDKERKIDVEKSNDTPYQRAKDFEILYEGERFYLIKKEGSSKNKLLGDQIDDFKHLSPSNNSATNNSATDNSATDIEKYDKYVEQGKRRKEKTPQDKEKRKKILEDLLDNPKNIKEVPSIDDFSLDTLLALMKELKEMKRSYQEKEEKEKKDNTSKYAQAIGHLLKYFSERIQSYKDFVSAEQKLNKFEDSFYEIVHEGKKQQIFISSYGCKLIHTQALQDEAYPKYNRLYRQWVSEAQDEALNKANEVKKGADDATQKATEASKAAENASMAAENASKAAQDVSKAAENASKAVADASKAVADAKVKLDFISNTQTEFENDIETTKHNLDSKISDLQISTRKEAISILSIFVALLSFISGGINILQGAASLADYLILTSTLYIFIASIIFFLYFKGIEGDKQEKEFNWSKIVMLIATAIAIRVVIVGLCIKFNSKTEVQDNKGSLEMNVKVENFKQASPNVKQITNSSSDSSKTSDVIKGDQGKKKTENASKEQEKKQGESRNQ